MVLQTALGRQTGSRLGPGKEVLPASGQLFFTQMLISQIIFVLDGLDSCHSLDCLPRLSDENNPKSPDSVHIPFADDCILCIFKHTKLKPLGFCSCLNLKTKISHWRSIGGCNSASCGCNTVPCTNTYRSSPCRLLLGESMSSRHAKVACLRHFQVPCLPHSGALVKPRRMTP